MALFIILHVTNLSKLSEVIVKKKRIKNLMLFKRLFVVVFFFFLFFFFNGTRHRQAIPPKSLVLGVRTCNMSSELMVETASSAPNF